MIWHKVEPRCAAWAYLRLGRPTSSDFDKIITAGGKPSKQADDYARRLAIRSVIDRHCPSRQNAHLTHGQVALVIRAV